MSRLRFPVPRWHSARRLRPPQSGAYERFDAGERETREGLIGGCESAGGSRTALARDESLSRLRRAGSHKRDPIGTSSERRGPWSASRLDGAGLAPSRRRARHSVRSTGFGFSWPPAVSLLKPPILGVGFPWISLDSLVQIGTFQWVTRNNREEFFHPLFRRERAVETASPRFGMAKGRLAHGASLTEFLIFCKTLLPEPFPPPPKSNLL